MKVALSLALVALSAVSACSKNEAPRRDAAPAAAAAAAPAHPLAVGDAAPDVALTLTDGQQLTLGALRGKSVVVYFYPKDETSGCTAEAEGIRDAWTDFEKQGVEVFGVSTQDAASHRAFSDAHKLPFRLVVDPSGEVAHAFGVPVNNGYAARQTFLIGRDGRIKKVWHDVNPSGHARELLSAAQGA